MYGFEHVGMGLGMILVWAIPIVLAVLLIHGRARGRDARPEKSALEILEARYARGEIERDEYLKRRAYLEA